MKTIPYGHQSITGDDIKEVVKTLMSDRVTQGPKINEFESVLCGYSGAKYAVVVSSGTAALHIACMAAGIKPGSEAITSPITFAASANCVLYCAARPVFADIEPDTANIDPAEIAKNITSKTAVLIPVHFAGHPCDLEVIGKIAKENRLIVIEDAAHALGAEYKDSRIGSCRYSDMAIFSFHPVKSVTTGEGGAVLTNRKDLYEKLCLLRNHGIAREKFCYKPDGKWYYEMQDLGYNYRMTDIQASLGISQMKKIGIFIEKRRKIAGVYNKAFNGNPYFDISHEKDNVISSFHLYPIRLKDRFKRKKREIFSRLREKKLGVQVHYMPVYMHPYYRKSGFVSENCPIAEDYYKREISIPLYPAMTNGDIKSVINILTATFEEFDRRC